MAGPGRPRRLNPDTEEVAELAGFLLQLTKGLGIRELSEQFSGTAGKSQWALWLKGDKDVPLEVLRQLIEARLPAEHRAQALKRAKALCASAEASRAGRGRLVPAQRHRAEAETAQAYKELAAARQGLLDAREALYRSKNLVLMLLWMIESLNSRIEALQAQPQQPTTPGPVQFRAELERAEDQLRRSETELARARAERDLAQQLHAAGQQRAEELERRVAELAQSSAPLAPALESAAAAPVPEPSADEYELALERVSSGLDANARELQQLQERLDGAEGPPPRAPDALVVHEEDVDNVDNVDNSVAMTSKRASDDGLTGHVVRGEALSRTAADNPALSSFPLSRNSERPSAAAPAEGVSGVGRALTTPDAANMTSGQAEGKVGRRSGRTRSALPPVRVPSGWIVEQRGAGQGRGSRPKPWKPVVRSRSVRAVTLLTIGVALLFGVAASEREVGTHSQDPLSAARPSGTPSGRSGTGPKGMVYLGTDTAVAAVDTAKGTRRWSWPATPTSAVLADGLLYSSKGGLVDVVDTATGKKRWSTPLKQRDLEVFAVTTDSVYVNSFSDLIALDAATGKEQWTRHGISGQVADDGLIYGWNSNWDSGVTVYALEATTGKNRWSLPTTGYMRGLTVSHGIAYVYVGPGILYALNASTGEEHWTYTTQGSGGASDPLVVGGSVYVTAGRNDPDVGGLYAVDAATGKKRWTYPGTSERSIGSALAFANNTVYVGLGDELLALDTADGKKQWGRTLASYSTEQLLTAGDTVYASGEDHSYALNATTGEEAWNYPTGATNILEMADGVLYIGRRMEDSSEVLALDPATGKKHWSYPAFDIVPAAKP